METSQRTPPVSGGSFKCPFKAQDELIPIEVYNYDSRPQPNTDRSVAKSVFTM